MPLAARALDEAGFLVLPSFVEPHAHLDKAFLAETVHNPTGDLMGAILAMHDARDRISLDDTIVRAERAARLMLSNGVTAIRTHADTTEANGLMSVQALIEVRNRLRGLIDIQVCALTGWPTIGAEGADSRALLREAIAMGVDLIGGCPHLETDPCEANENFLAMAAAAGLPVDLHTDETLNPDVLGLADLAERVIASGFPHGVTASHCCSLSMQSAERQQEVAELVAEAGIHVIALPQTNLFLQGRDRQEGMPRALTAVRALRAAGVDVAAGADNLQDPFNPVGRGDPLETASLMIASGHLLPDEALHSITAAARATLDLAPHTWDDGWVAIPARTVREAIAFGPAGRVVGRGERVLVGPDPMPSTAFSSW